MPAPKALFDVLSAVYPVYFLALLAFLFTALGKSLTVFRGTLKKAASSDGIVLALLVLAAAALRLRYTFHIDLDPYGWDYLKDATAIKDFFLLRFPQRYSLAGALHPPGYPFLASGVLFFSEHRIDLVSLFNLSASLLTIALLYGVAYFFTGDRTACAVSAGMLAFSALHIHYSGQEFPFPVSVFFIVLEFFCLLAWLESKNRWLGWAFVLSFFVSLNIKIENIAFLPLFAAVFLRERKDAQIKAHIRVYLKYIAWFAVAGAAFLAPFLVNLKNIQAYCVGASRPFFSLQDFLGHFHELVLVRYRGMPLWFLAAYAVLASCSRHPRRAYILVGWFLCALLHFFYAQRIYAEWSMMNVLIPVFVLAGFVFSQAAALFFKSPAVKHGLLAALLLLLFFANLAAVKQVRRFSWVDLRAGLKTSSAQDCIVVPSFQTVDFSLKFLFPGKKWVFLGEEGDLREGLAGCNAGLYYFDPVPYGLQEEAAFCGLPFAWEGRLREDFDFTQPDPRLAFYKLEPKAEE